MIKTSTGNDTILVDYNTKRVDSYTDDQMLTMRIVAIVSSSLSLSSGLVFFYLYICMRRRSFRHHLILLLIMSDFLKATVLLLFPARLVSTGLIVTEAQFCAVVGFLTAFCIEMSDLAVLALAVHFAMLVFTNRKQSNGSGEGLYPYRYWVYALAILIPAFLAAIAFTYDGINTYRPYTTWCYLPVSPFYLRVLLSWLWRYLIFISIWGMYIAIYIYFKLEYKRVTAIYPNAGPKKTVMRKIVDFILPCLVRDEKREEREKRQNMVNRHDSQSMAIDEFQREQLAQFSRRRSMIERQIKSIFIYPTAYCFLWGPPFTHQILQYRYELVHHTVFWVAVLTAWFQPFNCLVDTVVFIVREKPWRDRKERVFTTEYIRKAWNWVFGSRSGPENGEVGAEADEVFGSKCTPPGSQLSEYSLNPSKHCNHDFHEDPLAEYPRRPDAAHLDPFSRTTAKRWVCDDNYDEDDHADMVDMIEFLK